jgi:glycosyltransferase involved in cell wall biosynthesis
VNIDFVQPKFKAPTGAERFILSLGRALAARSCRVRIVCHQFDPRCRALAEGLIVDESGLRLDWSGNHYLDSISSYLQCFRLRRRFAPDADVVCLFGPALPLAALHPPRPARLVHFCYEPPRAAGIDRADVLARVGRWRWLLRPALAAYGAIDHWLIRRVDDILVSGPFAEALVREEYQLPSHVITPGVTFDTPRIGRSAARAALGLDEGDRVALTVNFLHPRKRVDLLLRAWAQVEARVPGARLLVVGDGPEREALIRTAGDLRLTGARFTGYVTEEAMVRYYAASDLVVHAARQETFGLTVVEAAAFGVPSIVADEGGPRYTVIDGETGLRVRADEAAIAASLTRLLGDVEEARRMGEKARETVAPRYTWQRGAEDFLNVFVAKPSRLARGCG